MISLQLDDSAFRYKKFNYPTGETHIDLNAIENKPLSWWSDIKRVCILFDYEKDSEIIELCLLKNALDGAVNYDLIVLEMPYVPFSREDRRRNFNSFSLKWFCGLINNLNFNSVTIYDAHSDVTTALIDNIVEVPQETLVYEKIQNEIDKDTIIICPDSGALKKIIKIQNKIFREKEIKLEVVQCTKNRCVETGDITNIIVHSNYIGDKHCLIIDDICDGGGTFCGIVKELNHLGVKYISLFVTHGFFTKGKKILNKHINEFHIIKDRSL